MKRVVTAVVFIAVAIFISVASLMYIGETHETMEVLLTEVLESAIAEDKEKTEAGLNKTLYEWEKRDDILNVLLGQAETNDVKTALNMAMYFCDIGDTDSAVLYINECRVQLERIESTNSPSFSTIL